jgi:hypothetical protein
MSQLYMSQEVAETVQGHLMVLLAKAMAVVIFLPTVPRDKMETPGILLHLVKFHMVQDQTPTQAITMAIAPAPGPAPAPVAIMVALAITSLVAHFQAQPVIQAVPKTISASSETVFLS